MALWQEFNNIDARDYAAQHPRLFEYVREQMTLPGKQFLLIGDPDHYNEKIQTFLNSPTLAALLKYATIPHTCIERPREIVSPERLEVYKQRSCSPLELWHELKADFEHWSVRNQVGEDAESVRALASNEINELASFMAPRLLGFASAGLRMTAADSLQWKRGLVPGLGERLFLGDREVASYIKQQAHGEKTAVIYGASHFRYDGSIRDRLGRENCVCIEISDDMDSCVDNLSDQNVVADMKPDMIYLLKEKKLVAPDDALYGMNSFMPGDSFHQRSKRAVTQAFGPQAGAQAKSDALGQITRLPGFDPKWFTYVPTS